MSDLMSKVLNSIVNVCDCLKPPGRACSGSDCMTKEKVVATVYNNDTSSRKIACLINMTACRPDGRLLNSKSIKSNLMSGKGLTKMYLEEWWVSKE